MKKLFRISMGLVIALLSTVLVSCSVDYSDEPVQAQKKTDTETTTPTPQPDDEWSNCLRRYHKVFETSDVESYLVGQRGGKGISTTVLDSLTLKYKYIYSLAADTTLYLEKAPTGNLTFSPKSENTWISDYTHNAQGDSVAYINFSKPYILSNGVSLSLTTQRMHGYHMMGGRAEMYSEPNQRVGQLQIGFSTDEFEKNDTIWGRRINLCSVELTLGDKKFVPSCKVTEIWFKSVVTKETPEPEHQVTIGEHASFVAGSKCKVALNNWTDDFLFKGATKAHTIVITPDANGGRAIAYNVNSVELNRVVFNDKVNGNIYDTTTGLHIPALITPDNKDKNGWFTEGVIDGRSVTYDPTKAQAVEEGIKNFVDKDTSVPTPFFINVSTSSQTWHEYTYVTITWSKYSKDADMVTQTVTVKMPSK